MARFHFDTKQYPTVPGCYLMKDTEGTIIYVGKAKNLRRRLASYFQSHRKTRKTRSLVARIRDIEVIIVNNETESLILENNLIKHYRPQYNRALMKDSTGYPYIVLTNEALPRFVPYRKNRVNRELGDIEEKSAEKRFGPYINTSYRDVLLDFVIDNFQIRTCNPMPSSVCLSYHLGTCSGICEQKVSEAEYHEAISQAVALLSYRHTELLRQMEQRMLTCAEQLEFEKAARIKRQMEVLENALEKQIVERDVDHDQDVLWFGEKQVLVMEIKQGAILFLHQFDLAPNSPNQERKEQFLFKQYAQNCPSELIVNQLENNQQIAKSLTTANAQPVQITQPKRGVKLELLNLCRLNYEYRTVH